MPISVQGPENGTKRHPPREQSQRPANENEEGIPEQKERFLIPTVVQQSGCMLFFFLSFLGSDFTPRNQFLLHRMQGLAGTI